METEQLSYNHPEIAHEDFRKETKMLSKSEQNKAIVRRFWKAYEANDLATLKEVLAPELVVRTPGAPKPQNRDIHLQGIKGFNAAFSDRHFRIDELIAEGDTVATRTTLRGVHTGNFQGNAPTGQPLVATGLTLERIKDGKIVERWFSFDVAYVMQKLGFRMSPQVDR